MRSSGVEDVLVVTYAYLAALLVEASISDAKAD
jgi:hypothetical protein